MTPPRSNLAVRVISGVLLFPVLVWITWRGGLPFTLLLAAAAGVGAWELTSLYTSIRVPELFGVVVAACVPIAPWWAYTYGASQSARLPLALAVAAMVLLVLNLFRREPIDAAPRRVAASALAWLYCGVLISSVVALRLQSGFAWVILAFVVTWMNDTSAYFAGRFLGKHPLLPHVSPKKTWEGFAGGVAGSVVGALGVCALFSAAPLPGGETFALSYGAAAWVGLGASILGPLGDLSESMLKRAAGVKDSGHIIPGHGGLLDRIDALLFVAPWIYLWAAITQ